jgi:hypothetical protein
VGRWGATTHMEPKLTIVPLSSAAIQEVIDRE